jgi:hypothetical protein
MGSVISVQTRRKIEAQGFLDLSDLQIAQLNYWLRLSPAICVTWTATGVYLGSPAVLAALVPFALLGGILKGHPFDVVYNSGIRFVTGGPAIPAYGKPRKFGCLMASVILSAAAFGFYLGMPAVGYVIGGMMALVGSVNVSTGYCLPSIMYGKLFRASAPAIEVTAGT